MNLLRPISISLSPNAQADDIKSAISVKRDPGCWREGPAIAELETEFKKYLGVKHAYSFNSGRSSLMAVLDALELPKGSQVLLQAFTCNAAANPIRWAGLEPVFVDCDQNYNLSVEDLKKKITKKSRAVMVQHTFGFPADMDEIKEICDKNNLILIEDCAHSLGAEYGSAGSPQAMRKIGTFGKAAFFSFGRDKMISCVYGGMAVTDDDELAQKIAAFQEKAGYPPNSWIRQQLLHPVLMDWLILPTYSILGRYLLVLFQWFNVLSKAIHWKEKRGLAPDYFPKRLPNALAVLALNQFKKLGEFNAHRRKLAELYYNELKDSGFVLPPRLNGRKAVYLRFAVRHAGAAEIIRKSWKKNLLIGDWYRTPVDPFDTLPETVGYKKGSCPNAERFAGKMINLPTHIKIGEKDAKMIVKYIIQNRE
ncbi:MAG: aminotransferase class I/II-fold pyridoxal phosphate-dependent enzyme [Minisyncoccales bacterium]